MEIKSNILKASRLLCNLSVTDAKNVCHSQKIRQTIFILSCPPKITLQTKTAKLCASFSNSSTTSGRRGETFWEMNCIALNCNIRYCSHLWCSSSRVVTNLIGHSQGINFTALSYSPLHFTTPTVSALWTFLFFEFQLFGIAPSQHWTVFSKPIPFTTPIVSAVWTFLYFEFQLYGIGQFFTSVHCTVFSKPAEIASCECFLALLSVTL